MNILFYVTCTPDPQNGGIERVSYILANEFIKYNHKCYCAYFNEIDSSYHSDIYKAIYHIPYDSTNAKEELKQTIIKNNINIVLNQVGGFWKVGKLFNSLRKELNFIFFTTYHSNPIENRYILDERYRKGNDFKSNIYCILYRLSPNIVINRINKIKHRLFTEEINNSDQYIVLSSSYKEAIIDQYKIKQVEKIISIPNPLTYNYFFNIQNYEQKKKHVIIVARFDELYKRLSRALKIWKSIEKYEYNGWKLIIIGHGKDENLYRNMISQMQIKQVEIHGKSNPEQFYKEASIFMMTSVLEGWPMAMQEAMQFGCIPIAFNTFSAVYDMIQDKENGYVINDNDYLSYSNKLMTLMNDDELRYQMAQKTINSTQKFKATTIANIWLNMMANTHGK